MTSTLLPQVPPTLITTRESLHLLAEQVIAPVRTQATGNEIALEAAHGGFGTPMLPDGARVSVDGDLLCRTEPDGTVHEHRLSTLHAAGEHAGLTTPLPDATLHVDPAAAELIGTLYAFGQEALSTLRAEAADGSEPSPIRLWPEHFDIAYEEGDEAAGTRAGFGISPGDEEHPEPYAYVTPWAKQPDGPLWNATAFAGAELGYADLLAADDAQAAVLSFFRERRDALQRPDH